MNGLSLNSGRKSRRNKGLPVEYPLYDRPVKKRDRGGDAQPQNWGRPKKGVPINKKSKQIKKATPKKGGALKK